MSGVWARFEDVSIVASEPIDLEARPTLRQALADGIERGFDGELPELPADAEQYVLRSRSSDVGLLALQRDCPEPRSATVIALAIDPDWRGNAFATKALMAAERRLGRDGIDRLLTRVPRTNGRGLYFMLRLGLTPVADGPRDEATWFVRGGSG